MAFGQIVDPSSGLEADMLSVFYMQLAGVTYLIMGGHRILVAAALDTFADIPPLGGAAPFSVGVENVINALASGAELALKVAAPVLVTLLLVNVALGFISRTVPQLNVATVGFSVKGMLAFVLMAAALPTALETFVEALEHVVREIRYG
jgi:flagellar biosynthetic protein FliR